MGEGQGPEPPNAEVCEDVSTVSRISFEAMVGVQLFSIGMQNRAACISVDIATAAKALMLLSKKKSHISLRPLLAVLKGNVAWGAKSFGRFPISSRSVPAFVA
jgi:hypothetical protein